MLSVSAARSTSLRWLAVGTSREMHLQRRRVLGGGLVRQLRFAPLVVLLVHQWRRVRAAA
jgi:hypothetical protein